MSATFSANNGASALQLQQKHNWKNPAMALEYIKNSKPHREDMAAKIQSTKPSTSTSTSRTSTEVTQLLESSICQEKSENEPEPPTKRMKLEQHSNEINVSETNHTGAIFGGFSNCTVNIYMK